MMLLIIAAETFQVLGRERYQPHSTRKRNLIDDQPGDTLVVGVVLAQKKIMF